LFSLLFVLLVIVVFSDAAWAADRPVRIGVLAYRGIDKTLNIWAPTAQYLTQHIPGYKFSIVPLNNDDIGSAIKSHAVEFVLTNPGSYVELASAYGITRIATLESKTPQGGSSMFGAVIFTRADHHDIRSLADLKGKRFMAVHKSAFGGWWMAWRELKHSGIDPYSDLKPLVFAGFPQDKIVYAVRDGKVDAGTVRTGLLESMALAGKIRLEDFYILNTHHVDSFPYLLSTELYPDWAFAVLPKTTADLAPKVLIALLQMKRNDAAALAGNYAEWSVPLDYHSVDQLMMELRVGAYRNYGKLSLIDILKRYWGWLAGIVTMLIVLGIAYVITFRINRELEHTKTRLEGTNKELEAFSYSVSHDLRAPLRSIDGFGLALLEDYAHVLKGEGKVYLERLRANTQRMGELIDAMLELSRVTRAEMHVETVDLSALARSIAAELMEANPQCSVKFICKSGIRAQGDPRQLHIMMENLLSNAWKYSGKVAHPRVEFGSWMNAGKLTYFVRDNGVGFDMANADKLFGAFQRLHTEADFPGTGVGLATVKRIIQRHHGRVWVESSPGSGATFYFSLN
jgi:signal transduction histidine kinase